MVSANICIGLGVVALILGFFLEKKYNRPHESNSIILQENLVSFAVGAIFGCGLIVAGMVRRINILQFLWLGKDWNPSLLFVLGCGVIFNFFTFNYMIHWRKQPVLGGKLFNPGGAQIDWKLVLGAACFGLGWGIGGLCPGPAIALLSVFQVDIHTIWFPALVIGMFVANWLSDYMAKREEPSQVFSPEITN